MQPQVEHKTTYFMGIPWGYFVVGNGTQGLLVLSGSLGGGREIACLAARFAANRRIIVPEYSPVATMKNCLDGIHRMWQAEGLEKGAVYGGSFGGLLAQCWVRYYPSLVSHMALSGAACPDPSRASANRRLLRVLPVIPLGLIRRLLRLALRRMLAKSVKNRETWMQEYMGLVEKLSKEDLASRYQIAIDFDENFRFASSDLPDWPGKILILEGDVDRIAGKRVRNELRALYPQATVHTFQGAGHSAIFTHTEEWLSVMKEFLGSE